MQFEFTSGKVSSKITRTNSTTTRQQETMNDLMNLGLGGYFVFRNRHLSFILCLIICPDHLPQILTSLFKYKQGLKQIDIKYIKVFGFYLTD